MMLLTPLKMLSFWAALLLGSALLSGCTSFETRKVDESQATKGYPFVFSKPYTAIVTYDDGTQSVHILSVPTLYAVDVKQSPIGTTDTSLENNDEGFAKKATAKIDHEIPENLCAVAALLEQLSVSVSGAPGAPEPPFIPNLVPGKGVNKIDLTPIS